MITVTQSQCSTVSCRMNRYHPAAIRATQSCGKILCNLPVTAWLVYLLNPNLVCHLWTRLHLQKHHPALSSSAHSSADNDFLIQLQISDLCAHILFPKKVFSLRIRVADSQEQPLCMNYGPLKLLRSAKWQPKQ